MSRLRRRVNTPIVYWPSPLTPGGNTVFSLPKESEGWLSTNDETFVGTDGKEIKSFNQMIIYVPLEENGYVYLGAIEDLTSDELKDPRKNRNALPIQKVRRTTDLRYKKNVWKVYL